MTVMAVPAATIACSTDFSASWGTCQLRYGTSILQEMGIMPPPPGCESASDCISRRMGCEQAAIDAYDRCIDEL